NGLMLMIMSLLIHHYTDSEIVDMVKSQEEIPLGSRKKQQRCPHDNPLPSTSDKLRLFLLALRMLSLSVIQMII
ncbi:hypothetical protein Hamer_G008167, partial [Homarus americanus]